MREFLKLLPCLLPFAFAACSLFVAGTTEETNGLANDEDLMSSDSVEIPDIKDSVSSSQEGESISSSREIPKSSSSVSYFGFSSSIVGEPDSSSSVTIDPNEPTVMLSRYCHPFWNNEEDEYMTNMKMEASEDDGLSVSYEIYQPLGGGSTQRVANFGIEISVEGDGPDVFSEMKTWTSGACYMLTSDVPIVLKMGMSPEKEKELEYDVPQATLIGPNDVGNLVIRCLSWLDFEQRGTGPAITIEDAFFDYMTSLRFEVQLEDGKYNGSFEIYEIRKGGTGISANVDGTDVNLNDGE